MNKIEKINLVFCQNLFTNAMVLMLILLITSCSPQSKESYLEDYKEFISEVRKENKGYTEQNWEKTDEKYKKFSGEWKKKFKDEFTWKEQIILTKYEFQYNLIKTKKSSVEFFNTYLKEDYDKLKEQIKYYSENEMDDDIKFLMKEAKEIGDSATKVIEEIFIELNIEIKKIQNK